MTFRISSTRICARVFGAALVAAFFIAAPIIGGMSAPAQAQREPASPKVQKPPASPQMQREPGSPRVQQQRGPGQAQGQGSVSAQFRTALEPHGRWQQHSRWGQVWIPANRSRDWRPYTVGRWVFTEDWGWYWVEEEEEASWGLVTYHYGRWISDADIGWAWIPGEEWGPGFVLWRHGSERIGWAPLPPDEIVVEFRERPAVWIFVGIRDFVAAPRLARVILPARDYPIFLRETIVVNRTVLLRDRGRFAVNPGIPATVIAAAIGRPIRAFEVRPRVLAGTAQIPGAVEVRAQDIRSGKDFVQIKTGPFDVDLVFAPDGIDSFAAAKARSLNLDIFRVANVRDIIASKRASNRQKDLVDLPLLEAFRDEYEKLHSKPLRTAAEIAVERLKDSKGIS